LPPWVLVSSSAAGPGNHFFLGQDLTGFSSSTPDRRLVRRSMPQRSGLGETCQVC